MMFDNQAEEAVNFYISVFKNAKIVQVNYSGKGSDSDQGTLMSATFQIDGQEFIAFNGGPYFSFSDGISLFVNCETQEEVDELWEKLSYGGEKRQCGWLKDQFGVSWQIIPTALGRLLQNKDPEKSKRVMAAMMQMSKIDLHALEEASLA